MRSMLFLWWGRTGMMKRTRYTMFLAMSTIWPASWHESRVVSQSNSRYRGPPWIIQLELPVVPPPQSPFSSSSTDNPRRARSRAMPAPVTPPPMMHTSCALGAVKRSSRPKLSLAVWRRAGSPLARGFVLLLELFDDRLGQVRRHLVVVRELLGVAAAALGGGAEVDREPKHLGLRHRDLDQLVSGVWLRSHHLAAAAVDVR